MDGSWPTEQVIGYEKFDEPWVVQALKDNLPISFDYCVFTNFDLTISQMNKYYGAKTGKFNFRYLGSPETYVVEYARAMSAGQSVIEILNVDMGNEAFAREILYNDKHGLYDDPEYFNVSKGGGKGSKGVLDLEYTHKLDKLSIENCFPNTEWTLREILGWGPYKRKTKKYQSRIEKAIPGQLTAIQQGIIDSSGKSLEEAVKIQPILMWTDYNHIERKKEIDCYTIMGSNHLLMEVEALLNNKKTRGYIDLDMKMKVQEVSSQSWMRAEKFRQYYGNGQNPRDKFESTPTSIDSWANSLANGKKEEGIAIDSKQNFAYLQDKYINSRVIGRIMSRAKDILSTEEKFLGDSKQINGWLVEPELKEMLEKKAKEMALDTNDPRLLFHFGSNPHLSRHIRETVLRYVHQFYAGNVDESYNKKANYVFYNNPVFNIKKPLKIVITVSHSSEKDVILWANRLIEIKDELDFYFLYLPLKPRVWYHVVDFVRDKSDEDAINKITLNF